MFLEDILQSCEKIRRYIGEMTLEEFTSNDIVYDAVVRNLTIIGEAAKHIPDEMRQQYSEIQWRKIAGFRDIAMHEYFGISNSILWDIIRNKIPDLEIQIKLILDL
jgi:uncharacterized protein with HEPN domain